MNRGRVSEGDNRNDAGHRNRWPISSRNYLNRQTTAQAEGLGFAERTGRSCRTKPCRCSRSIHGWPGKIPSRSCIIFPLAEPNLAGRCLPSGRLSSPPTNRRSPLAFCVGNFPQLVEVTAASRAAAIWLFCVHPGTGRPMQFRLPCGMGRPRRPAIPRFCWRPACCVWPVASTKPRNCFTQPTRYRQCGSPCRPMRKPRWPGIADGPKKR